MIPAVTCPALGAEEDADGNALIVSSVPEDSKGVAYRAEVEEAALGTPAAEVLDIEDDAEVMFRATRQLSTNGGGNEHTFSLLDGE